MKTMYLRLLRWMQGRCEHPDYAVIADILEGDWEYGKRQVQWCECCGAFRIVRHHESFAGAERYGEWRTPRPDWHTPAERKQLAADMAATIKAERQ